MFGIIAAVAGIIGLGIIGSMAAKQGAQYDVQQDQRQFDAEAERERAIAEKRAERASTNVMAQGLSGSSVETVKESYREDAERDIKVLATRVRGQDYIDRESFLGGLSGITTGLGVFGKMFSGGF